MNQRTTSAAETDEWGVPANCAGIAGLRAGIMTMEQTSERLLRIGEDEEAILFCINGLGHMKYQDGISKFAEYDFAYVPPQTELSISCEEVPVDFFWYKLKLDISSPVATCKCDPVHISDVSSCRLFDFGSNDTRLILDRSQTYGTESTLVTWPSGSDDGPMVAHPDKHQTFFVLSGSGRIIVGDNTYSVTRGDVVFVPVNTPHTSRASLDGEFAYLVINTRVGRQRYATFAEMADAVIPQRKARWERRDMTVGI